MRGDVRVCISAVVAVLAAGVWDEPALGQVPSRAITIDAMGNVDLEVNFRYFPAQAEITSLISELQPTKLILCDATDGQIKLRKVRITAGNGLAKVNGDIWVLPPSNTLRSNATLDGSAAINLYQNQANGETIAHELGHYMFAIGDEYDEQNRIGTGCGIGPSFDKTGAFPLNTVNNSIMQQATGRICREPGTGKR